MTSPTVQMVIWIFYLLSFQSAPYLSVAKLQVHTLTTVLYDRQKLCQSIGLASAQLPLLACLLGNDVVPETEMRHIRDEAVAIYRCLESYFEVRFQLIFEIFYLCCMYYWCMYLGYNFS